MMDLYKADSLRQADNLIAIATKAKDNREVILVFVHKSVDGDCIGSACATVSMLRSLGAKSYVAMPEKLPENMSFLNVDDLLFYAFDGSKRAEEFMANRTIDGYKYVQAVAVDCSQSSRMGDAGQFFDESEDPVIIDHHVSVETRGERIWVNGDSSSACELCYYTAVSLAGRTGKELIDVIGAVGAQSLMAGIVTDTGRFTYSNTRPETLTVAGELMSIGANISSVCYNLFDRKKQSSMLISSRAKLDAKFMYDGKLAITVVPFERFVEYKSDKDGVDEVSSALRDVDGVELSIVLREVSKGTVRGNLRSKSYFNCAEFASFYGGGGHIRAAGLTVSDRNIEELAEEIAAKVGELI